jgi:hypothetical protein
MVEEIPEDMSSRPESVSAFEVNYFLLILAPLIFLLTKILSRVAQWVSKNTIGKYYGQS